MIMPLPSSLQFSQFSDLEIAGYCPKGNAGRALARLPEDGEIKLRVWKPACQTELVHERMPHKGEFWRSKQGILDFPTWALIHYTE